MKRILLLVVITAGLLSVLRAGVKPTPTHSEQGRVEAGTNIGAQEVRLAFPEFQPKGSDPNAVKLTNLFNQVVWDDLDYSGSVALVSRSFYPVGKFQVPTDVAARIEDWTKQ